MAIISFYFRAHDRRRTEHSTCDDHLSRMFLTITHYVAQAHDPVKGWPTGLRDGLEALEETKTAHLPRDVCLGIGLPIVLSMASAQHVALGVCNNSDGNIVSIDLDPREKLVPVGAVGYRVVRLAYPPVRVVIFIQTAYDAGLHLEPLNRGEIAIGAETRSFDTTGLHDRLFSFKRTQLPLLPGHLSSVYRAQVRPFALLNLATCLCLLSLFDQIRSPFFFLIAILSLLDATSAFPSSILICLLSRSCTAL